MAVPDASFAVKDTTYVVPVAGLLPRLPRTPLPAVVPKALLTPAWPVANWPAVVVRDGAPAVPSVVQAVLKVVESSAPPLFISSVAKLLTLNKLVPIAV